MEDSAIRAIMIGVGLFVMIVVLSAILIYVSVARDMATTVDKGLNSWDNITAGNIMKYNGDISISCTGMDFINFLRKNFMREDISFTLENEANMVNQPISWWKKENTNSISELKMAKINPNATINMRKTTRIVNGVETYLITVEGSLFSNRDAYVTDSVWKMSTNTSGQTAYVTDGKVILNVGDTVNYVVAGNNATWKVLGADNGKILLLGSYSKQIRINGLNLKNNEVKLTDFNEEFSALDDGAGALRGSARCLKLSDIERLVDIETQSADYGSIYNLSWLKEGNTCYVQINGDNHIQIKNNRFYWWDKTFQSVKSVATLESGLPTLKNDNYDGSRLSNYTEVGGTKEILDSLNGTFLMYISTKYANYDFSFNLVKLAGNKLSCETMFYASSSSYVDNYYYVRPVIALEQSTKLEKSSDNTWNIIVPES